MRTFLLLGCLLFVHLFLAGCGATKIVATPPQVITPPAVLLEECEKTPITSVKTNSDLARAYRTLYLDFKQCNNQMRALKNWYQIMRDGGESE